MTEEYKKIEKNLKRKHRFGWTPKYQDVIQTPLNQIVAIAIIEETFEKLKWLVIYKDENVVEAIREKDWSESGNKISVQHENGQIMIESISLGGEMWDIGRNSKRVKLFIHVFIETANSYDTEALEVLEVETVKENNLENYVIPDFLPKPKTKEESKIAIPIIGGIITALLFGFILAFLSLKVIYIIGLFEVVIGFIIGFTLIQLIKLSNFIDYDKLYSILIGMVILTYLSNQYFQYLLIFSGAELESINFFEYMKLRFEVGLKLENMNTGWIGLVISWIIQLVVSYYIGLMQLTSGYINYLISRVPVEVIDFAFYYLVKEKTEAKVRTELAKKGWSEKSDQDEVFEAIDAVQSARELNRMV